VAPALDEAGEPVPEIAIAVLPEHRSRGVGSAMLAALAVAAANEGRRVLSLTVNAGHPALRLHGRTGFELAQPDGATLTMVRQLGRPAS
jgi:GNAT superfamily N-acetyltransferase